MGEEEFKNFFMVWLTVLVSLTYCHTIGKFVPPGIPRFCCFVPIVSLFLYLPLFLNTVILGSLISFFISWLASFKLFLFALGKGPLSGINLSLGGFLLLACLPIKIHDHPKIENYQSPPKCRISYLNHYAVKAALLAILFEVYWYREFLHPKLILLVCALKIYLMLELLLASVATLARSLVQVELNLEFNAPYLSSSLQDFWGKRWNPMVASILRSTVYVPVRSFFASLVGQKWAYLPAVMATFCVSGLMHELVLYQLGRVKPTWEVMLFFLLNGFCLVAEICIKKALHGRFTLPRFWSTVLVVLFLVFTGIRLVIFPVIKCKIDVKLGRELTAMVDLFKRI